MSVKFTPPDQVTASATPSAWLTALIHGMFVGGCGALVCAQILFPNDRSFVPLLCVGIVLTGYALRATRVSITANPENLHVSNLYRSVSVRWTDIREVDVAIVGGRMSAPLIRLRNGRGVKALAVARMGTSSGARAAWIEAVKKHVPAEEVHRILDDFEAAKPTTRRRTPSLWSVQRTERGPPAWRGC